MKKEIKDKKLIIKKYRPRVWARGNRDSKKVIIRKNK